MNWILKWLAVIIIVTGIFVLGWLYFRSQNTMPFQSPQTTVTPEGPTITPELSPQATDIIPEGWVSFESAEHSFSLMHPPDLEVQQRPRDTVRFIKFGPSQTEGTEVFDAISLTFNSGTLGDLSLEEFVQNRFEEARRDPISSVISSVEQREIGGYSGYSYGIEGLGQFTHIYLPNGDNRYLHIINGTVDPTNQGFEQTVDRMFSTLETGV